MPRKPGTPRPSRAKAETKKQYPRRYTRETCPDRERFHSELPYDIVDRAKWILAHLESHQQSQCPTCGLWVIWQPRELDDPETLE